MRIIIIGDHDPTKLCRILETHGVDYDFTSTFDGACQKVFEQGLCYNGIVLDVHFPESEGMKPTPVGKTFLKLLEEKGMDIPVLLDSFSLNPPKSKLVVDQMFPWELYKFEQFLNAIKNKG